MKKLSIFLHLGNVLLWDEIEPYFDRIKKIKFDLYINFCEDTICLDDIILYKSIINEKYKNVKYFTFENRGSDIGPFFLFLNYLIVNNIDYESILKIHSKSNNEWRNKMLNDLIPENFDILYEELIKNNKIIYGSYKYPYDYLNIKYDIENLKLLNLDIRYDWKKYEEEYKETEKLNPIQKNYYFNKNISKNKFIPIIDLELYEYLFGDYKNNHDLINGIDKWSIINKLKKKSNIIFYYPGTYLLMRYSVLKDIFKDIDLVNIQKNLEKEKLNDKIIQSKTHSWERILPLIFILKKLSI